MVGLERQIRSVRSIINGLLNNYGKSLKAEFLKTLMVECEVILNSRSLTVGTVRDVNSLTPLVPANILTMK